MNIKKQIIHGFTIVELLLVIVIIGILSTIGFVVYNGVQAKARDTSVLSDIDNMDSVQTSYGVKHGTAGKAYYGSDADSELGFTPAPGDVIDVVVNDTDYCIRGYNPNGTKNSIFNAYTKGSSPDTCSNYLSPSVAAGGSSCPTGFIRVPGSSTYGTNDFCVMKYEAKIQGNDNGVQVYNSAFVPESRSTGTPWVNISQTNAIAEAQTACPGCYLISEARWLTIAQNVMGVASNWDDGADGHVVGVGSMYIGHSNEPDSAADPPIPAPQAQREASTDDSNGYVGTGDSASLNPNQRRTLTLLPSGEVIWDMSGNVWDWTSGTVESPTVEPCMTGYGFGWYDWTQVDNLDNPNILSPDPSPAGTGISGASGWDWNQGIGRVQCLYNETALKAINRGGAWYTDYRGPYTGILQMDMGRGPDQTGYSANGFRVVR